MKPSTSRSSSSRLPPATSTKRAAQRRSPVRVMIPWRATVELGRHADAAHDARAQLVQLAADAPADDGAVADLAGGPARGLQDERALVRAGDERGQRLGDVDRERDERADAERHLLFGEDGGLVHTRYASAAIADMRIPRRRVREFAAVLRLRPSLAELSGALAGAVALGLAYAAGRSARPDALRPRAHARARPARPRAARRSSRSARSPRCPGRVRASPARALAARSGARRARRRATAAGSPPARTRWRRSSRSASRAQRAAVSRGGRRPRQARERLVAAEQVHALEQARRDAAAGHGHAHEAEDDARLEPELLADAAQRRLDRPRRPLAGSRAPPARSPGSRRRARARPRAPRPPASISIGPEQERAERLELGQRRDLLLRQRRDLDDPVGLRGERRAALPEVRDEALGEVERRQRAQVDAVHPLELLGVEDRRRRIDALEREEADQLLAREQLALGVEVPAEQREEVDDRLGEVAGLAQLLDAGRAVPLREALAIGAEEQRQVRERRHRRRRAPRARAPGAASS